MTKPFFLPRKPWLGGWNSAALGLRITGAAGVLTDAAAAGLIDFEATFQRLALTKFRLADPLVEILRQRHQARAVSPTT